MTMTGWLLVIWVRWGGYVSTTTPIQIGPFANEAACQTAAKVVTAKTNEVAGYFCVSQS